jgi:hypothetical protein
MKTTTVVIVVGVAGLGGYVLYKKLKAPTGTTVGKSPSGADTQAGGSIWDQLNAAFGGSKGGSQSDAQQAAGVFVGLGALASGIGSLIKSTGWGSGGSDTASTGYGGNSSSWDSVDTSSAAYVANDTIVDPNDGGGTSDWTPSLE